MAYLEISDGARLRALLNRIYRQLEQGEERLRRTRPLALALKKAR